MEVINLPISEVKPYENNPRNNDGAVESTANSIKEFGWQQPIVVDKDKIIIVGHTRLKAAKSLGLSEVPVVVATDLTDEKVKAYRLADNKVGELADWNKSLLDQELDDLYGEIDMSDFGFPVQIENLDEETEARYPIAKELGEANNYVVLEFKSELEWEQAKDIFNLKKVAPNMENADFAQKKPAIGHVIEGAPVLEELSKAGVVFTDEN